MRELMVRYEGFLPLAFVFALAAPASAAEDARQIVSRALDRMAANDKLAQQYTYIERNEQRQLDGAGKVTKRDSKTWDVTVLEGTPYRRLIARNDRPLPPDEEKREADNLKRSIEARKNETPEQRKQRFADVEAKRRKQLDEMRQVLEAYDFKIVGEDKAAGEPVWVIEGSPRQGYRPRGGITRFFSKVKGRIWITKTQYDWVRSDAELIETISIGLVIARIHKGTRAVYELTRVNNEVWLPRHVTVSYSGRIALLKYLRGEVDITYKDFRKFRRNRASPASRKCRSSPDCRRSVIVSSW